MDATSEGGVILPGADNGVPVDPKDPTKGRLMPVLNAAQLTEGVLRHEAAFEAFEDMLRGMAGALRGSLIEAAERIEDCALVIDHLLELAGDEAVENLPNPVDEAHQRLLEYMSALAGARSEAEVDPAFAGPEATPPVNPEADGDGA